MLPEHFRIIGCRMKSSCGADAKGGARDRGKVRRRPCQILPHEVERKRVGKKGRLCAASLKRKHYSLRMLEYVVSILVTNVHRAHTVQSLYYYGC